MSTEIERIAVRQTIEKVCDDVKAMLLDKNSKYGNSVLEPINVFFKGPALDGIRVRIDDKLKRMQEMMTTSVAPDEDTMLDLIGYLILYRVGKELGK